MQYLLPFYYGFKTRVKTLYYKISFVLTVLLPILYMSFQSDYDYIYILPRFIIAFIAMYSMYEIGYVNNDVYTVQFEKNPTLRLTSEEYKKVKRLSVPIISIRIFYVFVSVCILIWLGTTSITIFILMLGLLEVTYALHNYFRNRINIFTMFILNVIKYCSVPVLFFTFDEYISYILIVSLVIPLVRALEKIMELESFDFDRLRLLYYVALTVIFFIIFMINKNLYFGLVLSFYFLMFRLVGYLIIKKSYLGKQIKNARETSSWKSRMKNNEGYYD